MDVTEALSVLARLEKEMKGYEFGLSLSQQRLNDSFVLLAMHALQAYLRGDVDEAAEDFATLADEIRARQHLGIDARSHPFDGQ